jgi:type IV pilus assembly protein PilO
VVGFLYWKFGYSKNREEIGRLKSVHSAMTDSLQKARRVAAQLPEMERRLAKLEKQWLRAQEMLPSEKEIPSLLSSMTKAGGETGASFLLFQPKPAKPSQYYTEIPIQVTVVSTYHGLGRFLAAVGNLPRIVNVSGLTVKPSGEERATVEAGFQATTYLLRKEGRPR